MDPGDLAAAQFQVAKRLVQGCADFFDGIAQTVLVPIRIPKHKVGCELVKKTNGLGIFDVATVKNPADLVLL